MLHGVNPATFWFLPMLGKHPDEYPRFRDCFLQDKEHPEYDGHIHVYIRTGGGNRDEYITENQAMREMPGFVADFDDSFDCTYASWVFTIPERWQNDFNAIVANGVQAASREYIDEIKRVFPKIADQIEDAYTQELPAEQRKTSNAG